MAYFRGWFDFLYFTKHSKCDIVYKCFSISFRPIFDIIMCTIELSVMFHHSVNSFCHYGPFLVFVLNWFLVFIKIILNLEHQLYK